MAVRNEGSSVTFEIKEHIGIVSEYDSGWNKELNIVSWNGGTPKYDIRDWDVDHERMSRGITLMDRELRKIVDLFIGRNNKLVLDKAKEEKEAKDDRIKASPRPTYNGESESSITDEYREMADEVTFSQIEAQQGQEIPC